MQHTPRVRAIGRAVFLGVVVSILGYALHTDTARAEDDTLLPYGPVPSAELSMIKAPGCLAMQSGGVQVGFTGCESTVHTQFLSDLRRWRELRKIQIGYDGARYNDPALAWTQAAFIQSQAMVEERYLFDPDLGEYTVDRYLDDLVGRYGGIDAILLWPVYPNLGIDDRNQLDMVESMPGGVAGVRRMVAAFHRRHVRVLFPMTLWDKGTRDPKKPWETALTELMKATGADGVNADTLYGAPLQYSLAAQKIAHPLAFEPEFPPADEGLAWNLMSWWEEPDSSRYAQFVPNINRYKWLEPRHMVHISDRLNRDHTDDIQVAFFNGIGWESWENVWGIWNGLTARNAEATRRTATIERGVANYLVSDGWEPFYPMLNFGVFGSFWPLNGSAVWTIVNRNEYDVAGQQLSVPFQEGYHYFDLYHGTELTGSRDGDKVVLSFPIEARGFGAVWSTRVDPDARMSQLMKALERMSQRPLAEFDAEWKPLDQQIVPIPNTKPSPIAPEGMVEVPSGDFDFVAQGTEIEGDDAIGVDVAYPWESSARRFHRHRVHLDRFYIDKYPVSNAQYKSFLEASHYRPKDPANFLKDWRDGTYPRGWANKPVTWVSLEDARAYAAWAGKRLPHEWEWQYAAQGTDGRLYPWGSEWRVEAVPVRDKGRSLRGPDDSTIHPTGASPFGVMDLVGNVWQWTDEFVDDHTRAATIRGGSYYQPQGATWYFPMANRNDQHGKLLLMGPSRDRAGTIGFRCVVDSAADRRTRP
jgi:gamma-glutamyl hercynylcysteine S-oxide synthase